MRILQLGDPVLRQASAEVARPADAKLVVRDLRATLGAFRREHGFGRGISAIQVGEPVRVICLEHEGTPYALVNARLEWRSEEQQRLWDDCFSFPNLMVWVERSWSVRVRYQDPEGAWKLIEGAGPLAELLQHEMDHLDGILAVDRAIDRSSFCTREEYERRSREPGTVETVRGLWKGEK